MHFLESKLRYLIPIDNETAFVQIMELCRIGDQLLSEPMMVKPTDAYIRHSALLS